MAGGCCQGDGSAEEPGRPFVHRESAEFGILDPHALGRSFLPLLPDHLLRWRQLRCRYCCCRWVIALSGFAPLGDPETCRSSLGLFGRGLGIAAASAAEGEMVPIRFGGISGEHTSLEVGACYYSTEEGHITTGVTGQRVGMAISVNDIMMGSC